MFGWSKSKRRKTLNEQPVSRLEIESQSQRLWQSEKLSRDDRSQLIRWMRIFIEEKNWEGCDGLTITDEMKETVATAAGLMVLRYPDWYFDHTVTILIYPRPYMVNVQSAARSSGILGGEFSRAGETIYRGPVVLNWSDIQKSARSSNAGHHLVIHEFAHQLDMINGSNADGLPPLPNDIDEAIWRNGMVGEFEAARSMVAEGHRILMDDYGLTQFSEFFAVASELYFQLPKELAEFHPNVFELLKQFYVIDLSY